MVVVVVQFLVFMVVLQVFGVVFWWCLFPVETLQLGRWHLVIY